MCLHSWKIFLDLDLKFILLFLQYKKCLIYAASLKSKVSNFSNYIPLPLQLRGLLKVKITAVTDESIGLKVCVMCGGFKQTQLLLILPSHLSPITSVTLSTKIMQNSAVLLHDQQGLYDWPIYHFLGKSFSRSKLRKSVFLH